ncbi:unnamed protein product [Heligmosomoides polygyrus]|uniref:Myosin N-terminal SH3-like domain-containing protein n=1 Tax=Heligmosomoides polygyrus TaxID=6339 RepID=A0A183GR11_HELPZ|nr:unnamed protein product [Heligmosomoides polygyrus]
MTDALHGYVAEDGGRYLPSGGGQEGESGKNPPPSIQWSISDALPPTNDMAAEREYEKDPGWQYLKRSREQILKDQSTPYDSKKNVWIPDAEEGYVAAEIKSTKGDMVVVTVGDKEKTLKKDLLQEMNPPKFEKTEDMSNLTFLNDASVLYNLRARYASMLIYVSCFH